MLERLRAPIRENCRVRGIGIAENVSISTLTCSLQSCSLALTPNFCPSSMMGNLNDLKVTPLLSSRYVPINMSTYPSARSARVALVYLSLLTPERCPMRQSKPSSPWLKVW